MKHLNCRVVLHGSSITKASHFPYAEQLRLFYFRKFFLAFIQFIRATPHNAPTVQKWYYENINKQMSLFGLNDELSQARTKKREFLKMMFTLANLILADRPCLTAKISLPLQTSC